MASKIEWEGDSGWSGKHFFGKTSFSEVGLIAAVLKIDTPP